MEPPFKPEITTADDSSAFDPKFTELPAVDSPCDFPMSVNPFEGFTYIAPSILREIFEEDNFPSIRARSPRKHHQMPGT
jgi:hypothetical protein